jgi:hypothetical protein
MPDDTPRSLSGEADLVSVTHSERVCIHRLKSSTKDSDNDDIQSHAEQDTRSLGPGKPGRKKNPK